MFFFCSLFFGGLWGKIFFKPCTAFASVWFDFRGFPSTTGGTGDTPTIFGAQCESGSSVLRPLVWEVATVKPESGKGGREHSDHNTVPGMNYSLLCISRDNCENKPHIRGYSYLFRDK